MAGPSSSTDVRASSVGCLDLVGLSALMASVSGRPEIAIGLIDGPVALDHPDETDYTTTPSPHHPIGAKGIGESPNVGGVPCFSNAINDAFKFLGSTHIQMPHDAWRTWTAAEKLGLHA